MKSLAIFIVVWVVALYAMVSVSEHRRQNAGLPVVKSSVRTPRHPVAWRLNSVCMIDEHKSTEHIA